MLWEQLREQTEKNYRAEVHRVLGVRGVGLSSFLGAEHSDDQRQTEDDSAGERLFELWRNGTKGKDKMKFSIRSLWGKSAGVDVQQTWVIGPAGENVRISGESITRDGQPKSSGTIEFSARGAFDLAQALNVVAGHVEELSAPVPTPAPDPKDQEIAKLNEYAANLQDDHAALQKQLDRAHESEKKLNVEIAMRDAQIKDYQAFFATAPGRLW